MGSPFPQPNQPNQQLNQALTQLIPALVPSLVQSFLPLLIKWIEDEISKKQAPPVSVRPSFPVIPPDLEDIPPPTPDTPPAPSLPQPARAILEVLDIQHPNGHVIYYADHALDIRPREGDHERIEDQGRGFWERVRGDVPLNNRMKIGVTPTVFDAAGRELNSEEWDRLGWSYNIKYWTRLTNDPNNPESTPSESLSAFVGDGTPDTEITIDPNGGLTNVGGNRYRGPGGRNKGRAATVALFGEGWLEIWAEFPSGGESAGLKTEPLRFRVK